MRDPKTDDVNAGDPRTYDPDNVPTREGGQARARGKTPSHVAMDERRGGSPTPTRDG